ncbi:YadA-like family protein [Phascolarctobacterium sp.]
MSKRDMRAKKLLAAVLMALSMQVWYVPPIWAAEGGQTTKQADTVTGEEQDDAATAPAAGDSAEQETANAEAADTEQDAAANSKSPSFPTVRGYSISTLAADDDYGIMPLAAVTGDLYGANVTVDTSLSNIAIGGTIGTNFKEATVMGTGASANGNNSSVFGSYAKSTGKMGSAFGGDSVVRGDNGSAFGYGAISDLGGSAFGYAASSGVAGSAFGIDAKASSVYGSAFGAEAEANAIYSSAFGYKAKAAHEKSVAIGAESTTSAAAQVSFGTMGTTSTYRDLAGIKDIAMTGALSTANGNFTVDVSGNITKSGTINGATINSTSFNGVTIGSGLVDGIDVSAMDTAYKAADKALQDRATTLEGKTTNITYAAATGTTVDGVAIKAGVVTGVKSIDGIAIDSTTKNITNAGTYNGVTIGSGGINGVTIGSGKVDGVDVSVLDDTVNNAATGLVKRTGDLETKTGGISRTGTLTGTDTGTTTIEGSTSISKAGGVATNKVTVSGATATTLENNKLTVGAATVQNTGFAVGSSSLANGSLTVGTGNTWTTSAGITATKGTVGGVTLSGNNITLSGTVDGVDVSVLNDTVNNATTGLVKRTGDLETKTGGITRSGTLTGTDTGTTTIEGSTSISKAGGVATNKVTVSGGTTTTLENNKLTVGSSSLANGSLTVGTGNTWTTAAGITATKGTIGGVTLSGNNITLSGTVDGVDVSVLNDTVNNAATGLVKRTGDLESKTTNITYATATGTTVDGVVIKAGVVTGVKSIDGIAIDSSTRNITNAGTYNSVTIGSGGINGVTINKTGGSGNDVMVGGINLTQLSSSTGTNLGGIERTDDAAASGKHITTVEGQLSVYETGKIANAGSKFVVDGDKVTVGADAADQTVIEKGGVTAKTVTTGKSVLNDSGLVVDTNTKVQSGLVQADAAHKLDTTGLTVGKNTFTDTKLTLDGAVTTELTNGKLTIGTNTLTDSALTIGAAKVESSGFSVGTTNGTKLADGTLTVGTGNTWTTSVGITATKGTIGGVTLDGNNITLSGTVDGVDVSVLNDTVNNATTGLVKRTGDLESKTTNITYAAATGTTVDGVVIKAGVVTGVKSIDGIAIDSTTRNITNAGTYNSVTIGSGGINDATINKTGGSGNDVMVGGINLTQLNSSSGDAATTLGGIGRTEDTAASGKHITTVEGQLSVYETGMIANKDNKFVVEGDKVTVGAEAADQTVIEKGGVTAKTVTTGKSVLNDSGLVVDTNTKVQSGLVQADAAHKLDTTGLTVGTNTLTDTALTIGAAKVESSGFSVGTTNGTKLADGTLTVDADNTLTTANGLKATKAVIDDVTIDGSTVTIGGTGVTTELTKGKLTIGTNTLTDTALTIGGTEIIDKQVKVGTNTLTDTALTVGKFSVTASDGSLSAANGGFTVAASGAVTGGTYNGVTIGSGGINDVTINKQGGAGDDKDHVIVGGIDLSKLSEKSGEVSGNTSGVEHSGGSGADGYTTIEKNTKIAETGIETNAITASGTVTANEFVENGKTLADIYAGKSAFEDVAALVGDDSKGLVKDTKALKAVTAGMSYDADNNRTNFSGNLVVGTMGSGTHTQITDSAIIFGEGGNMQVTIDAGGIHVNQPTARGISTFAAADGGTHIDHNSLVTGTVTASNLNGVDISGDEENGLTIGTVNVNALDSGLTQLQEEVKKIQENGVATADLAGVTRSDEDEDGNYTTTIEGATSFTKDGLKTAAAAIGGVNFAAGGVVTGINSINGVAVSGSVDTGLTIGGVTLHGGLVEGVDISWLDQRVGYLEQNGGGSGGTGGGGGLNTSGISKPYPDTTVIEGSTSITSSGVTTNNLEVKDGIIVAKGEKNETKINKDGVTVGQKDSQSFINGNGLYIGVGSKDDLASAKFSIDSSSGKLTSAVGKYSFTNGSNGAVFSYSDATAYGSGSQLNTTIAGNKVTTGQVTADELWVGGNKVTVADGTVEKTEAIDNQLSGTKDGYNYKNGFTTSVADGTTQTTGKESTDGKDKWQTSNKTWAEGTTLTTTNTSKDGSDNTTVKESGLTTGAGGMTLTTGNKVTDKDGKVTQNTSGRTTMTGDSISVSKTTTTTEKDADGNEKEVTKTSSTKIDSGEVTLRREDGSTIEVGSAIEGLQNDVRDLDGKVNRMGVEIKEVGALSAALAGLHPQPENANSRADFAMAMGSYEGKQALAVGGFYRPDKRTMLSIGASTTSSKHMMNMGISIALDRLPEEERKAQEAAAADPETLNKVLERLAALEQDNQRLQADNKKRDIAYEKLAADYTQLKEKYTEKTAEKQQSETKLEEAAPAEADSSSEE